VAIDENTDGDGLTMLVLAAGTVAGLDGAVDGAVVGLVTIPAWDRDVVGIAEDFVIDGDTGEFVLDGADYVVSGDDPLLPAGSWLGVWDGTDMEFLAGVTVTMFGRRV